MKKNSNRSHFNKEHGKAYFANVSAMSARRKKNAKEAREQGK